MKLITEKDFEYKKYIDEHIRNVQKIWFTARPLFVNVTKTDYLEIDILVLNHDKSKYSEKEFYGYRQWFYPSEGVPKSKEYYNEAWLHHQNSNPHHWEYWILVDGKGKTNPLPIPEIYIIESLCDWSAMSIKFGDTPSELYNSNKKKMVIHKSTRDTIEAYLPRFDRIVKQLKKEV